MEIRFKNVSGESIEVPSTKIVPFLNLGDELIFGGNAYKVVSKLYNFDANEIVVTFKESFVEEIKKLLKEGSKLKAVKAYKEKFNIGLKEAKDEVDLIERNM